jgi:hypothetical protein
MENLQGISAHLSEYMFISDNFTQNYLTVVCCQFHGDMSTLGIAMLVVVVAKGLV